MVVTMKPGQRMAAVVPYVHSDPQKDQQNPHEVVVTFSGKNRQTFRESRKANTVSQTSGCGVGWQRLV